MKKTWSALAILIAVLGALYFKHEGVQQERQRRTADSLHTAQAVIANQSVAALAHQRLDSLREAAAHHQIALQRQVALAQAHRADSLSGLLRGRLPDSLVAAFDSLNGATAQMRATLEASRDSALAGWALAAAARDTLAALLRASQAQSQALSLALVRAQRVPFFSRSSVRIGMLAGAFLLGRLGR